MIGGFLTLLVKKFTAEKDFAAKNLRGILFASGMVAGDGLVGVIVAFMVGSWGGYRTFYNDHGGMMDSLSGNFGPWLAILLFGVMAAILAHIAFKSAKK
jgi:hypothetical protein